MRLLVLSWRDPWHPKRGGAEVFTYRLAQQLVAKGWSVEWCSASYAGAAAHETRDGIVFVRIGSQMTVHAAAFLRYRRSSAFDVIVDEINTIPFYAGAYGAGIPVVTLMFQLAREVWLQEGPPGLAQIGYVLEPLYLQPYRDALIATIAPSTVESFRKYGLRWGHSCSTNCCGRTRRCVCSAEGPGSRHHRAWPRRPVETDR